MARRDDAITVEVHCVALSVDGIARASRPARPARLDVLLARGTGAHAGKWTLPGVALRADESLEDAARRALRQGDGVVGLEGVVLEQLATFSEVDSHAASRVLTVAWIALARREPNAPADDASPVRATAWHAATKPPTLSGDAARIVAAARERLADDVRRRATGFELLPARFTLWQLQQVHQAALARAVDKRNFRKRALAAGVLDETDAREEGVAHRAARLYAFNRKRYEKLRARGIDLDL